MEDQKNREVFYRENMFYYRNVLGIAHHQLTAMSRLFRRKQFNAEEMIEKIESLLNNYKKERSKYHNEWSSRLFTVDENIDDGRIQA